MSLPLIIEPEFLLNHPDKDSFLIVTVTQAESYAQGHIENSILVQPGELVSGVRPAVGKLPDKDRLNALFSRIGYSPEKQFVVLDDEGGGWAGRFVWTLDVIGHQHSSYLNGGVLAWAAAGLPITRIVPEVAATAAAIEIDTAPIAELEDVLEAIADPDQLIWDARSAEEYQGLKSGSSRAGHIPGAINLDWLQTMDHQNNRQIHPQISQILVERGLSSDKRIITHCQSHHRSGLTYLIGKSLGYDIRAYHGSWSEWGNHPDTPIEL